VLRNEAERNANANGAQFRKRIKVLALGRYEIDEPKKFIGPDMVAPVIFHPITHSSLATHVGQQVR